MKSYLFILLLTAVTATASAQITRDTFTINENGAPLQVVGAVVQNAAELATLDISANRYPLFILPRRTAQQFFKIYNEKDAQDIDLNRQLRLYQQRDTLSNLEAAKLRSIFEVQQQHISLCEATNQQLNTAIQALDTQLTQTRELARDCNKGRMRRQTWGILVGGGIGFGLGALLGVIAAK